MARHFIQGYERPPRWIQLDFFPQLLNECTWRLIPESILDSRFLTSNYFIECTRTTWMVSAPVDYGDCPFCGRKVRIERP